MNGLLRKLPMIVMLGSLLYSTQGLTQVSPTTDKAAKVRITQGPEIERNDFVVIVRWTSNNPGDLRNILESYTTVQVPKSLAKPQNLPSG